MLIHNVFYSGLLKKYQGDPPKNPNPLPVILEDGATGYLVEAILRRRKVRKSYQYLVKWLGYPEYDASWEPRANLLKDVPDLVKEFDEKNPFVSFTVDSRSS